jgi:hypothetical protein
MINNPLMYQPTWEVMRPSLLVSSSTNSIKSVIRPYKISINIQKISSEERGGWNPKGHVLASDGIVD